MAEDMMQEPTVESAPVAQETSTAVEGDNQQVQADQSTAPIAEGQPATATQDTTAEEMAEWNGNDVEKLPKPLQARAKGILRYLHDKSQEAAQVKHLAQAYQEMVNHPEFQEFIQWKEQRLSSPQQESNVSSEPLSEDDFLAAQTDPNKFVELQQKLLMQQAGPVLKELSQLKQELTAIKREKVQEQAARQLDAFASQHPDFWKIDSTLMKSVLEDVVQKKGGSVEDAYNYAKTVEKRYLEQAKSMINKQVEEKKKAVTASPSKSMEPEVIYVKDSREATRVAFENAKLGKRVDVRVKR